MNQLQSMRVFVRVADLGSFVGAAGALDLSTAVVTRHVAVLVARHMRSASIVTRRLTTGYLTVCATPAYLAQHGTPTRPEHLLSHPCLSRPAEQGGEERVFSGPNGEVRVRPTNAIVANNTEM